MVKGGMTTTTNLLLVFLISFTNLCQATDTVSVKPNKFTLISF